MKAIFKLVFVTIVLSMSSGVQAQKINKKTKDPGWVSKKGFWQIQSNIHTPEKNIVYFYNNDKVLIYTENVNGVVLNLGDRRVKMRLKKALERAVLAWNKNGACQNDRQWITGLFKR